MKAESTIRKQMHRLRRIFVDSERSEALGREAYGAYHALMWVVTDTAWTPAGEAEKEAAREAAGGET